MTPLRNIIFVDIAILIVAVRFIFGSYTVFLKSMADHFFPDDLLPNPLAQFAEKHDSRHKINILYAAVLFLAGLTVLFEIFLLR